jgi:hypothetical protein
MPTSIKDFFIVRSPSGAIDGHRALVGIAWALGKKPNDDEHLEHVHDSAVTTTGLKWTKGLNSSFGLKFGYTRNLEFMAF